ncbi:MAG: hypothetical protein ACI9JL_003826 [Paracoccaceae bacterium]|jgi:hypothetical protein
MIRHLVCAGLAIVLATAPAAAQRKTPVDLELSFVVDASGSIDQEEIQLQRQGYADALANPQVQRAISSGFLRSIAVTYIEFAADQCVWQWLNWTKVSNLATARAAGAKILAAPREFCSGGNAIGDAVAFATKSTLENSFDGTRKVIDVSGDGPDTTGAIAVEDARAVALANGFTINGLVIHRPSMPELGDYYRSSITGGPRSFVIKAESRRSFADAIVKKLILEISDIAPDRQRAAR